MSKQLSEQFKQSKWAAYSLTTTDDQVTAAYKKRYGVEPAMIWRDNVLVMAGPLPDGAQAGEVRAYEQAALL